MAQSKVAICNLALAALGADPIRDFDENNKRARQCDVFYDTVRDRLLSKHDWSFARNVKKLMMLVQEDFVVPDGEYVYQLPADCKKPRDVTPFGQHAYWRVQADRLYCQQTGTNVFLKYTRLEDNVDVFTDEFIEVLYLNLAVAVGPSIVSNWKLISELKQQAKMAWDENIVIDSDIGSEYRHYDETPESDTFVTPDRSTPSTSNLRYPYETTQT